MPVPVAVKQSVLHAAKKKRSPSFSHNRRILQPSASTVIHEVTHEHTIEHVHDHSDHEDDNESLVIEELTAWLRLGTSQPGSYVIQGARLRRRSRDLFAAHFPSVVCGI